MALLRFAYIIGLIICGSLLDEGQSVEYYKEAPAFLKPCRMSDANFSNCSRGQVQKLLNQLAIGIPEVEEAFGPFDPMRVRDIEFNQDNNEAFSLRVNLTNIVINGFSNLTVKESKVTKKDYTWYTKIFLPKMRMTSDYNMDGRILLLTLNGAGKLIFELENLDINMQTLTRLFDRGGFTFDNVTAVRVKLNMTRVRSHLDNLFNGNKELERTTNQFFNDNWRDFYVALRPLIVDTVQNIMFDVMHKVFNLIPANFFVEDIPTAEQFFARQKGEAKPPR